MDELKSVFSKDNFDFLIACGYTKATSLVKMTDVQQLVKAVWLHFVKFNIRVELEELRKGLRETLEFHKVVSTYPDCVWKFLVSSTTYNLTSSYLQSVFVIIYSDEGSNFRIHEEAIVFSWLEYITECEGTCSNG